MSCVQRSRVLRRGIEIPEKLDGYSVLGAKVQLDLSFASNAALVIALFSNGSVLYRGDQDMQKPILRILATNT